VVGSGLARKLQVPLDRAGRIVVCDDLTIAQHPDVFAIGDIACLLQDGVQVPGVAPAAVQQAHHTARNILRALAGKPQAVDADEKEDLSDFALWKAHKPDDGATAWESPWGRGRPGWHIECSAMSKKHLGDTIDLHTGGVDLLFPHHENEIAQSECCNGAQFSHHWYHSEHLLVDGKKMSKSLGNLYTLDELAKLIPFYDPIAVRFVLLQAHPRKQLSFTLGSVEAAQKALKPLEGVYNEIKRRAGEISPSPRKEIQYSGRFSGVVQALNDDLNFPAALGALFSDLRSPTEDPVGDLLSFERALRVLGLRVPASVSLADDDLAADIASASATPESDIPAEIKTLAEKRWAAKAAKDWSAADAVRKELTAAGWTMKDAKESYTLEPLKQ